MSKLSILDSNQVLRAAFDDEKGQLKTAIASSLVTEEYNELDLGYTGSDLTSVVYKLDGNVVATLTLSYSGGNLVNVVRS